MLSIKAQVDAGPEGIVTHPFIKCAASRPKTRIVAHEIVAVSLQWTLADGLCVLRAPRNTTCAAAPPGPDSSRNPPGSKRTPVFAVRAWKRAEDGSFSKNTGRRPGSNGGCWRDAFARAKARRRRFGSCAISAASADQLAAMMSVATRVAFESRNDSVLTASP